MFEVRRATISDAKYVEHLQDAYQHELGFLTPVAFEAYILRDLVFIGFLNEAPASYVLGRSSPFSDLRGGHIVQACVEYDARHRALGTALVNAFIGALNPNVDHVYLWCAQDIEANLFWEANGFEALAWRPGKKQLHRLHVLWHRYVGPDGGLSSYVVPEKTRAGQMRRTNVVTPLEVGQTWRDVKLVEAPSLVSVASPKSFGSATTSDDLCVNSDTRFMVRSSFRRTRPKRVSKPRSKLVPDFPGILMVVGGRVVKAPIERFTGRN